MFSALATLRAWRIRITVPKAPLLDTLPLGTYLREISEDRDGVQSMEIRQLGRSGLRVSALGLGTMTWGGETDLHEARDIMTSYYEAGGRLVATADTFGAGAAEEMLGDMLRD